MSGFRRFERELRAGFGSVSFFKTEFKPESPSIILSATSSGALVPPEGPPPGGLPPPGGPPPEGPGGPLPLGEPGGPDGPSPGEPPPGPSLPAGWSSSGLSSLSASDSFPEPTSAGGSFWVARRLPVAAREGTEKVPRAGVSMTRGNAGMGKGVRAAVGEIAGILENNRDLRRSF